MTHMKEIRGKDETELRVDLRTLREELFRMRLRESSEQNADPARIRAIRKDIARILTVLHQRGAGSRP